LIVRKVRDRGVCVFFGGSKPPPYRFGVFARSVGSRFNFPHLPDNTPIFSTPRLFQKTLTKSEKWGKITVAYKVSNKEKNK